MALAALTDAYVRAVVAPAHGRLEVNDSRCRGLALRVTAKGKKSWSFRFRDRLTGKPERLTLGPYPELCLARARQIADDKRSEVARGLNPRNEIRNARTDEALAIEFPKLADAFLTNWVYARTPRSAAAAEGALKFAKAEWKNRKARDLTRGDIIAFLASRAATAPGAANRTAAVLSKLFNWSVDSGHLLQSPYIRISKPGSSKPRDRILFDDEIAVLWKAIDTLAPVMARAVRFLLITGQRSGEVVGLKTEEIFDIGDPTRARWELPADRAKNGRLHVVPLAPEARAILIAALADKKSHDQSPWVFPSPRNLGSEFDRHSIARSLKRLILDIDANDEPTEATKRLKANPVTPHDFRRSFASGLARFGIPRETVKACLNHLEGDVLGRHYNRYSYLEEKRRAFAAWENHVLGMMGSSRSSEVVYFPWKTHR